MGTFLEAKVWRLDVLLESGFTAHLLFLSCVTLVRLLSRVILLIGL